MTTDGCKGCGRTDRHSDDCFVPMRRRFLENKQTLADYAERMQKAAFKLGTALLNDNPHADGRAELREAYELLTRRPWGEG